jgi:hypothetical protein
MNYLKELWNSMFYEPGCNPSEALPDGRNAVDPKVVKALNEAVKELKKKQDKSKDKTNGPY